MFFLNYRFRFVILKIVVIFSSIFLILSSRSHGNKAIEEEPVIEVFVPATDTFNYDVLSSSELSVHMSSKLSSNCSLIYVNLGDTFKYQLYIWESMTQTRLFNSNINLYLITSEKAINSLQSKAMLKELNVKVVYYETLKLIPQYGDMIAKFEERFFVQGPMTPEGNTKFNKFTTERLYAVYFLADHLNLKHIFHIENDNMIYTSLQDDILPGLISCDTSLALPRAEKLMVMSSFLYSRDPQDIYRFISYILEYWSQSKDDIQKDGDWVNDMSVAAKFFNDKGKYYRTSDQEFPSCAPEHLDGCLFKKLQFFFDAAVFGQKLGGTHGSPEKSHVQKRCIDVATAPIRWLLSDSAEKESNMLYVPYIFGFRLVNIHVHSKRLYRFTSIIGPFTDKFAV